MLHERQVEALLEPIIKECSLSPQVEITMEANPLNLDLQKIEALKLAGINRFSLGVQSFQLRELELLGRMHKPEDAFATVEALHQAGIRNFNLDLIYGIPNQSWLDWLSNLKKAVDLAPPHLSVYLLQAEPGTPLAQSLDRGQYLALCEDEEERFYYQGLEFLQENGYEHYEISNVCRQGYQSRHNLIYWDAEEYLGLGASAVSFIGNIRTRNQNSLEAYLAEVLRSGHMDREILEVMDHRALVADAIIMGLRKTGGISRELFVKRYGVDVMDQYGAVIKDLIQMNLITTDNHRIKITAKGYFLSNQVFYRFLP